MQLRTRIAHALSWSEEETKSFSLAAIRELLRPTQPKLLHELDLVIRSGEILTLP